MTWDDDDWEGYHADHDDESCDHEGAEVDVVTGEWWCHRCHESRGASKAEIAAEIARMAEYFDSQGGG